MYGRKQSIAGIDPAAANLIHAGGVGGAGGPLGLDYGVEDTLHGEGNEVIWSSRNGPRKLLRFLSLLRYTIYVTLMFHNVFPHIVCLSV